MTTGPAHTVHTDPQEPAMPDTVHSPDAELERRLEELSDPENQGEGLRAREFAVLTAVTVLLPLVALLLGWFL